MAGPDAVVVLCDATGTQKLLLGPESGYCVGSVVFADGGLDAQQRPTDWPRPASPPEQE